MRTFTGISALLAAAVVAAGAFVQQAHAVQLRFDVLEARWDNTVGGVVTQLDNVFSPNLVTVNWGEGGTSGYDFDAQATPITANPSTAFDLGDFTHRNQPINSGTAISSVDLFVRGSIVAIADDLSESVIGVRIFEFNFDHNETTNNPGSGICDFGGPVPCGDVVTVSVLDSTDFFNAFGLTFTLNILGFVDPSTNLVSNSFLSPEEGNNTRVLRAEFTTELSQVPEPGTMLVFGLGLIGLWVMRRRTA